MNAKVVQMYPLPALLQAQLIRAGWVRMNDSLFACNVNPRTSQPERGVWLTRRASDAVEVVRPIARDDGPRPALRRKRANPADDMYSLNGLLVLAYALRFPPNIREVNAAAFTIASRTPEAPRELDLTIEDGWSPFVGTDTWELRRWWIDDGRSDW